MLFTLKVALNWEGTPSVTRAQQYRDAIARSLLTGSMPVGSGVRKQRANLPKVRPEAADVIDDPPPAGHRSIPKSPVARVTKLAAERKIHDLLSDDTA
eukprot:2199059-Rhodomonas_salina.1